MGVFDTLTDGNESVQVKCFDCLLKVYYAGSTVPSTAPDMTVVCPDYSVYPGEGKIFALIKDHKFVKLTRDPNETYPPYIDKWGEFLSCADDFKNQFRILVEQISRTVQKEVEQ